MPYRDTPERRRLCAEIASRLAAAMLTHRELTADAMDGRWKSVIETAGSMAWAVIAASGYDEEDEEDEDEPAGATA